ncbi:MAG: hypothetical protein JXB10_07320 [Pirellulales bacterium]|nr:hypothetical protein [Pirellulales bacterium]
MKPRDPLLIGFIAGAAALLAAGGAAQAEKSTLELVRLDSQQNFSIQTYLYRYVSSQPFFMQIQEGKAVRNSEDKFSEVVKKEPEKYFSKHPFRGAAKLGSQQYGFVLDKKDEKSDGYDRLYFDLNGNGDLTDDKPIDGKFQTYSLGSGSTSYGHCRFPRADLTIEVDGQKLDYSFLFSVNAQEQENFCYVNAQLSAAAYRKGEITLGGKPRKIAVIDFNSNGRFDDLLTLPESNHGPQGELYSRDGDKLLIDPEESTALFAGRVVDAHQQYLSKLNALDGKFYEVKVTPSGDEITWTPAAPTLGQVVSPHAPCSVTLLGPQGYLVLDLKKSQPAAVPVGTWRVLGYDITVPWEEEAKKKEEEEKAKKEAAEKKEKKPAAKPSLFGALKKAILSAAPESSSSPVESKDSIVSANGSSNGTPVIVEAGETTTLKFGPPYSLHVNVYSNPGQAYLNLQITGSDKETVSNMTVKGQRPEKPKFSITDSQGEVVKKGSFDYG